MTNDPQRLRALLKAGMSARQKSVDGATALHRCAEVNNIECAQILLEHEAFIDAVNLAH